MGHLLGVIPRGHLPRLVDQLLQVAVEVFQPHVQAAVPLGLFRVQAALGQLDGVVRQLLRHGAEGL